MTVFKHILPAAILAVFSLFSHGFAADANISTRLHVSWGHRSAAETPFCLRLAAEGITIADAKGEGLESGDESRADGRHCRAGGGDVDALALTLQYQDQPMKIVEPDNTMWRDLIAQGDRDAAARLRADPAIRRDSRKLTVTTDADGLRGFSVTIDQLLAQKAMWIPSLDVYLVVGDAPPSFDEHLAQIKEFKGTRVLERVAREPEATYADFTARWEDMGNPAYKHPAEIPPGHIIGLAWDGSLRKFGIDRGGNVWNDLGNEDHFRLGFDFTAVGPELAKYWKSQWIHDGAPIVVTSLEKDGVRYDIEQFAYPLDGPPADRRGDVPMVLMQKVTLENPASQPKTVRLNLIHRRAYEPGARFELVAAKEQENMVVERTDTHEGWLAVQGLKPSEYAFLFRLEKPSRDRPIPATKEEPWAAAELFATLELPGKGKREFLVKLPSPSVAVKDWAKLQELDFNGIAGDTCSYWWHNFNRSARFSIPDNAVHKLFNANIWHAMRLPRRHGPAPDAKLDLPYSNFWYEQTGTPWPINQAVYIDYMLYDLRGYHDLALEELLAIYRDCQQPNGHIGGAASWGSYTPGMVYASAKHYLLSHDREGWQKLLPSTLKALDWCLAELRKTADAGGPAAGLFRAPLNDCTGDGVWAFNQAYAYAALDTLGRALRHDGHPRANECRAAAEKLRKAIERAFALAAVQSPLVQLRDRTWSPYVPSEALTPRRLTDQWYPTDVDTGAVHLVRLGALPAKGHLADCLLNDHEDNLFLNGWGMANEPVYNQQATAYLLRDEPRAAIRAFYSMTACAFSHSTFEPIEHRWTWGQVFGPPSTDGAWFELYRNMLVRETDDEGLLLFQTVPKQWLVNGHGVAIARAPTEFGPISAELTHKPDDGEISAEISPQFVRPPKYLLVRLRPLDDKPIRSVTVNGEDWTAIDREKQWVRIDNPTQLKYKIVVRY